MPLLNNRPVTNISINKKSYPLYLENNTLVTFFNSGTFPNFFVVMIPVDDILRIAEELKKDEPVPNN